MSICEKIKIINKETNREVLARICKASARKFDCDMEIDFEDGKTHIKFIGDDMYKPYILEEIVKVFNKQ